MGGGYFPFFTENRPQKHKKHAILHTSQANGGARAPPAPPWLRYWLRNDLFLPILIFDCNSSFPFHSDIIHLAFFAASVFSIRIFRKQYKLKG